jgi:uncharacterized metal-binding protein YceD (DUF177 family)
MEGAMSSPVSPQGSSAEFSRVFRIDELSPSGSTVTLAADAAECGALARRFGLLAMHALTATVRIAPRTASRSRRSVKLEGRFEAEVEQECVVTLEPVRSVVADSFVLRFAEDVAPEDTDVMLDAEGEDPPEPLVDGAFDLGEAVAELVALAIDPYPRAPGAVFEVPAGDTGQEERASPFAVLRRLSAKS